MILPEETILRASKWCYRGVWSIITKWFRVPEEPPQLAGADDADIYSFRPAEGFLRYLKLAFWIGLVAFDGGLLAGWILLTLTIPWMGILLAVPIWAIMVLPDIVVYVAIHLRYDTTWYVLSDRSMRIRRGIWSIHETTITYDNIQNVAIRQGPLQRYFGISNVLVETAGGGATAGGEGAGVVGHSGLLEGIANADEVRNLILAKWRDSKSAGLGDESTHRPSDRHTRNTNAYSVEQIELLRAIRDLAVHLANS